MDSESPTPRDDQLRRMLVAMSELAPLGRRLPSRRLLVASVVAFALAGSLTAGALAVATSPRGPSTAVQFDLKFAVAQVMTTAEATSKGAPVSASAAGSLELPLVNRPAGAIDLALGLECLDPGTYTVRVGSTVAAIERCHAIDTSPDAIGNAGPDSQSPRVPGTLQKVRMSVQYASVVLLAVPKAKDAVTISGPAGSRFAVLGSWVTLPDVKPSAAERAELADGTITKDEYFAAFYRFEGCMTAKGYPISAVHFDGQTFGYSPGSDSAAADGAFSSCLLTEFQKVSVAWRTQGYK